MLPMQYCCCAPGQKRAQPASQSASCSRHAADDGVPSPPHCSPAAASLSLNLSLSLPLSRRHIFCEGCLQTWLPLKPECPECRAPVEASVLQPDRLAERLVSNVDTRCQLAKAGCAWVGRRGELLSHLALQCQCVSVTCPNEGCGAELPRRELAVHAQRCPALALSPVMCPFGCGHACIGGPPLERHMAECLMSPSKLMAAISALAQQNEQLTLENERLARLTSRAESTAESGSDAELGTDTRVRKAMRRRAGPGVCID